MPNAKINCFVDTNVLLYAQDLNWPEKRRRAVAWLNAVVDKNLAVISPQVMNEFAAACSKKLPHLSSSRILETLEELQTFCRAPTDAETAIKGFLLHERFKLSFYDAVLIASALSADCGLFLSEDLTHFQSFGALRVVNPFLATPQEIL